MTIHVVESDPDRHPGRYQAGCTDCEWVSDPTDGIEVETKAALHERETGHRRCSR